MPEQPLHPVDAAAIGPDDDVRRGLMTLRAEALESVASAERDFERLVESARSVATDDEHDPDGSGGLAVERALTVAVLARARDRARELDRALDRLADGTYGRCERCGRPIGAERLAARPGALTCIGCARDRATPGRR